jgi:hypothetical protein
VNIAILHRDECLFLLTFIRAEECKQADVRTLSDRGMVFHAAHRPSNSTDPFNIQTNIYSQCRPV